MMTRLEELEKVLLNQIEMLDDETSFKDVEEAKLAVEKTRAISDLTANYIGIQQLKLNIVKELNHSGSIYEDYLGVKGEALSQNMGQNKRRLDSVKC
jgi:hypothetical protein